MQTFMQYQARKDIVAQVLSRVHMYVIMASLARPKATFSPKVVGSCSKTVAKRFRSAVFLCCKLIPVCSRLERSFVIHLDRLLFFK